MVNIWRRLTATVWSIFTEKTHLYFTNFSSTLDYDRRVRIAKFTCLPYDCFCFLTSVQFTPPTHFVFFIFLFLNKCLNITEDEGTQKGETIPRSSRDSVHHSIDLCQLWNFNSRYTKLLMWIVGDCIID